ncbi:hypothetical protein [Agrobacterium sp.]|jgi:hypothetical protein|uniref:hypothetical protein n=1 Tax=Agrobacterium sp. TaxID=361 RepID=UPI0028A6EB91|nr:hypothetical protein [Agrobacterium sp.]
MTQQLALDILLDEVDEDEVPLDVDLAASVLAAHDGDALSAIRNLLADADFLRDQLYIASKVMSQGMVRGWKPRYERPV